MPEKKTIQRARKDKREGKAPSTQAGEFVREEIHHVREGKHGVKSPKQAIAIGLSKARRAGVKLPPKGRRSASRKSTSRTSGSSGKATSRRTSTKRSQATKRALERMPRKTASPKALSRQAKTVANRRSKADRSRAAKKAARTRKRKQG